jgi:trans-aconitate methyltransferase
VSTTWDATAYDTRHSYVFRFGASLIGDLKPQPGEEILDFGCGTGHLTHEIAESGAAVLGIDQSGEMIELARRNYPEIPFEVADATKYRTSKCFDAVFSNAALHWMKPPEDVAESISRALKPGGRLVAELGGKGNTASILAITQRNPWYFPGIAEYASLLERYGLEVVQAMLFERPTPVEGEHGLRDWLRMFYQPPLPEDVIATAEAELRPKLFRDGTWYIDYRRLRVIAKRV